MVKTWREFALANKTWKNALYLLFYLRNIQRSNEVVTGKNKSVEIERLFLQVKYHINININILKLHQSKPNSIAPSKSQITNKYENFNVYVSIVDSNRGMTPAL